MKRHIKLYIHTGFVGVRHEEYEELPEDWDTMSEREQENYLEQAADDYLANRIEYGAYVVDKKS